MNNQQRAAKLETALGSVHEVGGISELIHTIVVVSKYSRIDARIWVKKMVPHPDQLDTFDEQKFKLIIESVRNDKSPELEETKLILESLHF